MRFRITASWHCLFPRNSADKSKNGSLKNIFRHSYLLRCRVQKVQDMVLAKVQGWCRRCRGAGGAEAVQGVQATCTVRTSASTISGAGGCRRCRHTPGCVPLKQFQVCGPTSTSLDVTVIPRGGVLQTSVMSRGGLSLPPPTPRHHRLC